MTVQEAAKKLISDNFYKVNGLMNQIAALEREIAQIEAESNQARHRIQSVEYEGMLEADRLAIINNSRNRNKTPT